MSENWKLANLKADIDVQAGALARLQELDQGGTLTDADVLARYRETVEAVRVELVKLRDRAETE